MLFITAHFMPIGGEPQLVEKMVSNLANGDLTVKHNNFGHNTGIYSSVLTLVQKLSSVITSSSNISHQVAASSEELTVVMQKTAKNI